MSQSDKKNIGAADGIEKDRMREACKAGNDMAEGSDQEINIEEIMVQIKEKAASRTFDPEIAFDEIQIGLPFQEAYDYELYRDVLRNMYRQAHIDYYKPRKFTGVKGLFQKAVRKFCSSAVRPLSDQQTRVNEQAAECFYQLQKYMEVQKEVITKLQSKVEQLEKELKGNG